MCPSHQDQIAPVALYAHTLRWKCPRVGTMRVVNVLQPSCHRLHLHAQLPLGGRVEQIECRIVKIPSVLRECVLQAIEVWFGPRVVLLDQSNKITFKQVLHNTDQPPQLLPCLAPLQYRCPLSPTNIQFVERDFIRATYVMIFGCVRITFLPKNSVTSNGHPEPTTTASSMALSERCDETFIESHKWRRIRYQISCLHEEIKHRPKQIIQPLIIDDMLNTVIKHLTLRLPLHID